MSLRDFNSSTDDRPVTLNHEALSHEVGGNGSGLGAFHTVNPEDREPSNTPKIIGALAVALMVGAAGAYVYGVSGKNMEPTAVKTAANIPTPAALPPASQQPVPAPMNDTASAAPADTAATTPEPVSKPAPVKTAATARSHVAAGASSGTGAAAARMAADTNQPVTQPQQQAAVIPEPVSPTPSPSDIARNTPDSAPAAVPAPAAPDSQTAAPATPDSQTAQNGTVAQQPTPQPVAPAQEPQTGAEPAPAAQPAPAPAQ